MRRAIYLFLGLTGLLLIYYVIARTIRARHRFPIPGFLVELIDNPLRRRFVQPPGETPPRHGIRPGMVVLEVGPGKRTYTLVARHAFYDPACDARIGAT